METVKEIVQYLHSFAPLYLQESYDNVGLLIGDENQKVTGILTTLDITEKVIDEAISKNVNVIVAHHPIIFKGLKKINGNSLVEKCVIKAIKNDINLIACHTNLDHVQNGVNFKLSSIIGLKNLQILAPRKEELFSLSTYVPIDSASKVLDALFNAGAGKIGNYDDCSFTSDGVGSFKPLENANPTLGEKNVFEKVNEQKIEVLVAKEFVNKVLFELKKNHPYEEVAYFLTKLENENQTTGAGMVGELVEEMDEKEFLLYLKSILPIDYIKYTPFLNKKIKKVAVCGGSGAFLTSKAIAAGCQVFISADFKYHDYFEAEDKILIADIGHYETEICTKELFYEILSKKFSNIAVLISDTVTKPYNYL